MNGNKKRQKSKTSVKHQWQFVCHTNIEKNTVKKLNVKTIEV